MIVTKYCGTSIGVVHWYPTLYMWQITHYDDVIMTMLASQITSLTVVYSIVYSGVIQRKHQSSASLAFVREIHRGPVNFPHKWPVTRIMFPFDDVIMTHLYGELAWIVWRNIEYTLPCRYHAAQYNLTRIEHRSDYTINGLNNRDTFTYLQILGGD